MIHSPSVSLLDELQHWGHVETPPSLSSSSAASLHVRLLRAMARFSLQNFLFISHTLPVIYFVKHCEEFTSFQKIFSLWLRLSPCWMAVALLAVQLSSLRSSLPLEARFLLPSRPNDGWCVCSRDGRGFKRGLRLNYRQRCHRLKVIKIELSKIPYNFKFSLT